MSWTEHLSEAELHAGLVGSTVELEKWRAQQAECANRIAREESYQQDVLKEFVKRWLKKNR